MVETKERVMIIDAESPARALGAAATQCQGQPIVHLVMERSSAAPDRYRVTIEEEILVQKVKRYTQRERWCHEHGMLRAERGKVDQRLRDIDARLTELDELLGGYAEGCR